MLQRLREVETEAGFKMTDSQLLDDALDGIDFCGLLISYNFSTKYGMSIHVTQPGIIDSMIRWLEQNGGVRTKPTYAPAILGWTPVASRELCLAGGTKLLSVADADKYASLLGKVGYASMLGRFSCTSASLQSRQMDVNEQDYRQLIQLVEFMITTRLNPLVFEVSDQWMDTTVPLSMIMYCDGGMDHGHKSGARYCVTMHLKLPRGISGSAHTVSEPTSVSSDTMHDELTAISAAASKALMWTYFMEQIAGHDPGVLNSSGQQSPFAATMIFTNSQIAETIEAGMDNDTEFFLV